MVLDLLLTQARVVDGTGSPWFRGSVGIADGQIDLVTAESHPDRAAETILNLNDFALAPGFIDAHSHSDLLPFNPVQFEPKLRQGVTTEVVGQDGLSLAPIDPKKGREWSWYLQSLLGEVDDGPGTWETTEKYLDAIDHADPPANVAMLVGHGTIRNQVMGMTDRTATDSELEEMSALVSRALDEGAVGFSTGLEYSPHRHANKKEIRQLVSQLAPYGRPFVAHIRSYSRDMWSALDEFVDVGASEGVPVHLSHFKLGGSKVGRHDTALEIARAARERGVDFTADLYPYVPASTMLHARLPDWVHVGGPDKILSRLRDEDTRQRVKADMEANNGNWDTKWDQLLVSHVDSAENEEFLGKTIADAASESNSVPFDMMCDLLIKERLDVAVVTLNSVERTEDDIRSVIADERVAIGSDALPAKHPHPRLFGTYPRLLGTYVRDLDVLSLEEAIRKMTSFPARIYGFNRKGIIRPGMDADLVVFDPLNVASTATVDNPCREPIGISDVLINGNFVVRDRELTNASPGSALRA